jgi:hypothetical protein
MRRFISEPIAAALLAVFASSPTQAELSTEPFTIRNAGDLVELCAADPAETLYDDAINFCHGFASGAWQYHQAQANGPQGRRLVCPPEPMPKRAEAVAMFVTWARSHPEHMSEPAVETLFRFLIEKWPCAETAAAKKGGAK